MKNLDAISFIKHNQLLIYKTFLLLIIVLYSFSFYSCKKEANSNCKDCLILHSSLDNDKVKPLEKMFDKIELIPLETTDNSLIKIVNNYQYDRTTGRSYVLDRKSILLIFDDNGNYLGNIDKRGQGPGEYMIITDFALNLQKNQIVMLEPLGFIYCYDFEGKFIKKLDLSNLGVNILRIEILDENNYVLWSIPDDIHDGIYIISQETGELVNSFWKDKFLINMSFADFYTYFNNVFFSFRLLNTVYKITKDGVEEAYEWNFGNNTTDINRYDIFSGMNNYAEDVTKLMSKLESREIQYECLRNFQNKTYFYTQLHFANKYSKHLFYNKTTKQSIWYDFSSEAILSSPFLYFSDEFIIGTLDYEEKDKLLNCSLLDEENKLKLRTFKDDDNQYLVKYYFVSP